MITEHPSFPIKTPKTSTIWRYMSFTKFMNLILESSLYFCRGDKFQDPFEGRYGNYNLLNRASIYENDMSLLGDLSEHARSKIYINCWHINNHESAAMWQLYSTNDSGIAIKSTIKDLMTCVDDEIVQIGEVRYIDYNNEFMDEGNIYFPFLYKRKSFDHEREIRLLARDKTILKGQDPEFEFGCFKRIDVDKLINSIYLSPLMPDWEERTIRNILLRLGLNFEIKKSSLYMLE